VRTIRTWRRPTTHVARRATAGRVVLAVGALAVVGVAGVTGLSAVAGGDRLADQPDIGSGSGPRAESAGVPTGYRRDAAGAAAAAANYVVVLGGRLTISESTRAATLAAVSASTVLPMVAERYRSRPSVQQHTGIAADVAAAAPMVLRVAPLGTRVRAFGTDRALVEVWVVSVVGTTRIGRVDMSWSTETVELVWEGDWKVRSYRSAGGPVPALHQPVTPLGQFLDAERGMEGFGYVTSR